MCMHASDREKVCCWCLQVLLLVVTWCGCVCVSSTTLQQKQNKNIQNTTHVCPACKGCGASTTRTTCVMFCMFLFCFYCGVWRTHRHTHTHAHTHTQHTKQQQHVPPCLSSYFTHHLAVAPRQGPAAAAATRTLTNPRSTRHSKKPQALAPTSPNHLCYCLCFCV